MIRVLTRRAVVHRGRLVGRNIARPVLTAAIGAARGLACRAALIQSLGDQGSVTAAVSCTDRVTGGTAIARHDWSLVPTMTLVCPPALARKRFLALPADALPALRGTGREIRDRRIGAP